MTNDIYGRHVGVRSAAAGGSHARLTAFEPTVNIEVLLRLPPAREDHPRQRRRVYGVSTPVVHPAPPQHRMVRGTDQPSVAAAQGRVTVGQRDLIDRSAAGSDQYRFDPNRARGGGPEGGRPTHD